MGEKVFRNLHSCFEQTFRSRVGQSFTRQQLLALLQSEHPGLPDGSVVPTDHAEPSPKHVNQCRKCLDPDYQIFDTVQTDAKPSYRVRDFQMVD